MSYIGNVGQYATGRAYMEGRIEDPLLFSGPVGCGKSTLAALLANAYGYEIHEVNASRERTKKAVKSVLQRTRGHSISGKPRLTVLDEIDGMPADAIKEILKQPGKKILICNEVMKVAQGIRSKCHGVTFRRPTQANYKKRLKQLDVQAPKDILDQFNSWRDLDNWMDGGDPAGAIIMSDFDQAKRIFEGEGFPAFQEPTIKTRSLLFYYVHSGGKREIVEQVNLLLSRDGFSREIARQILLGETIRVKFPFRKKKAQSSTVKFLGFA